MKRKLVGAAIAACVLGSGAIAQNRGDWVLAHWDNSNYVYPGVVQSRNGDTVKVRFDDGSVASVAIRDVRNYDWRVNDQIECQWSDGNWYDARITSLASDGLTLSVAYDDGTNQRTNTGRCRSL